MRRGRVVGFVYHLYQGDLDAGRVALERLTAAGVGDEAALEDFSYGAVAVAQRLRELEPEVLVLAGAVERGREAGTVERRDVRPEPLPPLEAQGSIADAVTGYIHLDLVVDVAHALGSLPARTVAVEIEPATVEPGTALSPLVEARLDELLELVRDELYAGSR